MAARAIRWPRVMSTNRRGRITCSACRAGKVWPRYVANPRQRGYRPRGAYGEIHPAIEKAGGVTVGLAHIHVLAAGVREHASQFGKGEARKQRHAHAHHPDGEKKPGMPRVNGHILGCEKNARANDAARQQENGVGKREAADEFSVARQYGSRALSRLGYNRVFGGLVQGLFARGCL